MARDLVMIVSGVCLGMAFAGWHLLRAMEDRDTAWTRERDAWMAERRRLMEALNGVRPIPRRKTDRSGGQGWPFSRSAN